MFQIGTKFSGLQKIRSLKIPISRASRSFHFVVIHYCPHIIGFAHFVRLHPTEFRFLFFAPFGTVIRSLTLHSLRSSDIRRSLRSAYAKSAKKRNFLNCSSEIFFNFLVCLVSKVVSKVSMNKKSFLIFSLWYLS